MLDVAARLSLRARIALGIALLAPLLSLLGWHAPGRTVLAVAFFLLVPGVALVELLGLPSRHVSWCLAIGLSLAVNLLVAQAQLDLHAWRPLAGQFPIAAASVALLVLAARNADPPDRADTTTDDDAEVTP